MKHATATATAIIGAALALSGCAAGGIASAAMELAGLRKPPELPELQKPPRQVAIRLHASGNLNAVNDAEKTGITIGLQACALSMQGQALAGTRCQP